MYMFQRTMKAHQSGLRGCGRDVSISTNAHVGAIDSQLMVFTRQVERAYRVLLDQFLGSRLDSECCVEEHSSAENSDELHIERCG